MGLCNSKKLKIKALQEELKEKELSNNKYMQHLEEERKKAEMEFIEKMASYARENQRLLEAELREAKLREERMLAQFEAVLAQNQKMKNQYAGLEAALARQAEKVVQDVMFGAMSIIKAERQLAPKKIEAMVEAPEGKMA